MKNLTRIGCMLLVLVTAQAAAHSDMAKPLFVANDGIDSGRCLEPSAPCRTIGYALRMVGKGGTLRIAGGSYDIDNVEDLFHLVSGTVDAQGSYDAADGFAAPTGALTTLVGVPVEYRSALSAKGFHVLADRKSIDREVITKTNQMLSQKVAMQSSLKTAACSGGSVNGLPCNDVDLLAHVPFNDVSANPRAAADVWGFIDLNTHREYVLVGYDIGTAVFDVSDAENPREVGFVQGQQAVWRDIKVHQHYDAAAERWRSYAYVTTDGAGDGMFVIDMSDLPHSIRRVSYSSDFSAAHNVLAANTDFATGLSATGSAASLIIAGSSFANGQYRAYTLDNPASPSFLEMPNGAGYMHDAASMIITDSRKDTQCVNASSYCEVLIDFNESTVDIWDITLAANPVQLSRTSYSEARYVHSGWVSEDKQYLFVQDELDEQRIGSLRTTLRGYSLADLTNPQPSGNWVGPEKAIDHNGFVRGNRYYMSNYSRGLAILDISDPTAPTQVGLLDTYPFSNNASFVGAWGAYPYLPSGNIAISDIDSGFYLAADRTLDVAQGSLSFSNTSYAATEGQSAPLSVARIGGASGAVSVGWEAIPATAEFGDVAAVSGTINWAAGDTTAKTIDLSFVNDGVGEGMESMLIKLVAPAGGATLSSPSIAHVYASDPGATAEVQFGQSAVAVSERGFGTAVVVLQRSGTANGQVSVDYALSNGDATAGADYVGATTGTVSWADGDANPKSLTFDLVDDGIGEPDEFIELSLSNPSGAGIGARSTTLLTIKDGSQSNRAPNAVAGSSQNVAIGAAVTLDGSGSNDPDGDTLTYAWTQTMGPAVTLSSAASASASFAAPSVTSDTLFRFDLKVTDIYGSTDTSTASVTVLNPNGDVTPPSGGGGGSLQWLLLCLGILAARRQRLPIRTGADE